MTQSVLNGFKKNGTNGTHNDTDGEIRLHGGTKLTNNLSVPEDPNMSPPPLRRRSDTVSEIPAFMVSAPGKVIVYGEHAVVYAKGAIAAALSLRSYLLVTPRPKSERIITLRFADISLDHSWDIDTLPWHAFSAPGKKKYYFDTLERLDHQLLKALKPLVANIAGKVLQNAAISFLYLYLVLGSKHSPAAIYTLRSTIPIGAGLGSSASIAVCLSAALLLQNGQLSMPFKGMMRHETQLQLKRVNNWAFVGEMCIHGNPSGVDNTVSTGGKALYFRRNNYQEPPEVTHLETFPELPLLLVNTRHPRSTHDQVESVRRLKERHETITDSMLDAIDLISTEALEIISDPDFSSAPGSDSLTRLGDLIRINHGLLVSLGVSHPKLERIRELIDHTGIGWTKLTGAGGGGCSITLLKPNVKQSVLNELEVKLGEEGFEKYKTTLGGPGVGVMWPAVIRPENQDGDQVIITEEMMLGAAGMPGVEALCGVGVPGGGNWKFWTDFVDRA